MKRLFLSSLALCIVFLSQAQIKKGQILLGGSLGYSHESNDYDPANQPNTKFTSANVSPSIGWAIKDNLVFGVNTSYTYQKNEYQPQPSDNYNKTNSFGAGVFIRKYKYLGSGFSFFAQSSLNLTFSDTRYTYTNPGNYSQQGYGGALAFYPGVAFAINSRWQIETGFPNVGYINYNHTKYSGESPTSPKSTSRTNTFNVGSSLSSTYQLTIGLKYIIG